MGNRRNVGSLNSECMSDKLHVKFLSRFSLLKIIVCLSYHHVVFVFAVSVFEPIFLFSRNFFTNTMSLQAVTTLEFLFRCSKCQQCDKCTKLWGERDSSNCYNGGSWSAVMTYGHITLCIYRDDVQTWHYTSFVQWTYRINLFTNWLAASVV